MSRKGVVANSILILFTVLLFFSLRDLLTLAGMTKSLMAALLSGAISALMSYVLKDVSELRKLIVSALGCVIVVVVAYIFNRERDIKEMLYDKWLREDRAVTVRFVNDSVYIHSKSNRTMRHQIELRPGNILLLDKDGEIEFVWQILQLDNDSLVMMETGRRKRFSRIN